MPTGSQSKAEDTRRTGSSPRPKDRVGAKDILCRNVHVYGHCRFVDQGCVYYHPVTTGSPQPSENMKKKFNVDSPSFTPSSLAVNGSSHSTKPFGLSSKAASAAPFRPKSAASPSKFPTSAVNAKPYNPAVRDWVAQPDAPEFIPQNYDANQSAKADRTPEYGQSANLFDPFASNNSTPNPLHSTVPTVQANPYAQDTNGFGATAYFQGNNTYTQPLQHHLYAPQGPYRDTQANQRMPKDFFIDENLRQFMQKRSEATLKTFSNVPLPDVEQFHTLVNLDFSDSKSERLLGYPSWLYKAISGTDGSYYCLRRLEGFKSTNQTHQDVVSVQQNWKRVRNGNVVSVHLAFTSSRFNGPSLFFVTDYHPCSETLAQKHFGGLKAMSQGFASRNTRPNNAPSITEQVMWSYLIQIANALKAIHDAGLAAKVIDASKVILTSENHLRLNGCAILDVAHNHDDTRSLTQHQAHDLHLFGTLLLALGTSNASSTAMKGSQAKALEIFRRNYTSRLCSSLSWLLDHENGNTEPLSNFLPTIAAEAFANFDAMNHFQDHLYSTLNQELENGRHFRIISKLNMILNRPEYEQDVAWSQQGTRYVLLLARDYIFHQVDANGRPVDNLAHIVGCLNRLDAGIDEKVALTSRDNAQVMIVTWKEIKTCLEGAWNDLYGKR